MMSYNLLTRCISALVILTVLHVGALAGIRVDGTEFQSASNVAQLAKKGAVTVPNGIVFTLGQAVVAQGELPGAETASRIGLGYEYNVGGTTAFGYSCPSQCDFDGDGFLTALDLSAMIDILFGGDLDIQDHHCPVPRADFDCDGFSTALDMSGLIDHLFAGGPGPCDPVAR